MNRCERVRIELEALRSGELLPADEVQVRAHLEECRECAEEAAGLSSLGARVSQGLKGWVDAGRVPPLVALQIEATIRPRRLWWTRLGVPAGVAAAAVLLMAAALYSRPEWGQQLAAAPVVGGLFQTFLGHTLEEYQWRNRTGSELPAEPPVRVVDVGRTVTVHGVTLLLDRVEFGPEQTKVEYRLEGGGFRLGPASDLTLVQPVLSGPSGTVAFRNAAAQRKGDVYHFNAFFDAVSPDVLLSFQIDQLPQPAAGGPRWEVGPDRLAKPSASFRGMTVVLTAWTQVGNRATATVEWASGEVVRFTGWTARDASGKLYPVKETGGAPRDGRRSQTITIEVPDSVSLILEAETHDVIKSGPWQITIGK